MSLPVLLRPDARREFDEAFDWYENQRPGRGEPFATAVLRVLDQLEALPELHPVVRGDIRRAVVPGFPCLMYYRVLPHEVAVIAIVHGKRDRGHWRART